MMSFPFSLIYSSVHDAAVRQPAVVPRRFSAEAVTMSAPVAPAQPPVPPPPQQQQAGQQGQAGGGQPPGGLAVASHGGHGHGHGGHGGQHYSLRWNNHQSHVLSAFDDLLQSEALVDCTLVCEDTNIKAHKVVLSACR